MQRFERWKVLAFISILAFAAIVINGAVDYSRLGLSYRRASTTGRSSGDSALPTASPQVSSSATATPHRKTPEELAAEHAEFVAKYVNPGFPKKSATPSVTIAAISEDRRYNNAVANALAKRAKAGNSKSLTGLFTPEFISQGLFDDVFSGSTAIPRNLDLINFMDVLVLAKQTVDYSKDPALNDLVSAHMAIEIVAIPLAPGAQNQSWTLKSDGAGFNRQTARSAAEERILVQLAKATNIDLFLSLASGR